jgi:hypothetical protein
LQFALTGKPSEQRPVSAPRHGAANVAVAAERCQRAVGVPRAALALSGDMDQWRA